MRARLFVVGVVCLLLASVAQGQGGSAIVRIPTPTSARCINSHKDEVTVTLRRIITQKTNGFFTNDNKAGITVISTLNADGVPPAKTPSVNLVDIHNEPKGQVSLALEYPIASQLALTQTSTVTKNMLLDLYLEKTRGSNTFGQVLTTAGQFLGKLPIPANPYLNVANEFLQFANQTIQSETTGGSAKLFATITLAFNDRDEASVASCLQNGFQPTGAIVVVRDTGAQGTPLLQLNQLSSNYCWRYNSDSTYAVQYANMPATGCSAVLGSAWSEVPNDYVMLIVSAATVQSSSPRITALESIELREDNPLSRPKRFQDLQESAKLCQAMKLPSAFCGVQ